MLVFIASTWKTVLIASKLSQQKKSMSVVKKCYFGGLHGKMKISSIVINLGEHILKTCSNLSEHIFSRFKYDILFLLSGKIYTH